MVIGTPYQPAASPQSTGSLTVPKRVRFPSWHNFWELPAVLGLVYLAHTRYRRYSPRRLPTLTSMRTWEIYSFIWASWTWVDVTAELKDEVLEDPDLLHIEEFARAMKKRLFSDKDTTTKLDKTIDVGYRNVAATLRARYHPGLLGRLSWWYNNIWSSEQTWYRAALIWHFFRHPES